MLPRKGISVHQQIALLSLQLATALSVNLIVLGLLGALRGKDD